MKILYLLAAALMTCLVAGAGNVVVTVGNGGNNFMPASFIIAPGDTVTWVWYAGHHNTSALTVPAGAIPWYANITGADTLFRYVPQGSGLYQYTCTHHSGMDGQFFVTGCSYPDKPVISETAGAGHCQADTVILYTAPQNGATYQWLQGVTLIPGAQMPSFGATASGAYKVLVNRCGVDSVSDPFTLALHPLPAASFTYTGAGLSFTFLNSLLTPGPYRFSWSFGDGTPNDTGLHASHTFPGSGPYTVTLSVTDTFSGCTGTATQEVSATLGISPAGRTAPVPFPNPATRQLHISAPPEAQLSLVNIHGQAVYLPQRYSNQLHYLDVSDLPSGLYMLHVHTSGSSSTRKIMVAH